MTSLKFLFIASILGIGFFSCKKDDIQSPETSGERLKRMVSHSDSMWYVSFQYDGQGRLTAIKDTNSQMHIGNTSIQYDQQNRMIKMIRMRYYQSTNN
jgi:YD repeat-containing protein